MVAVLLPTLPTRVLWPFASPAGGFLDRVVFLLALAAVGATSGVCAPTVATGSAAPNNTKAVAVCFQTNLLGECVYTETND